MNKSPLQKQIEKQHREKKERELFFRLLEMAIRKMNNAKTMSEAKFLWKQHKAFQKVPSFQEAKDRKKQELMSNQQNTHKHD